MTDFSPTKGTETADYARYREIAEKATPGEWNHWGGLATSGVNAGTRRVIGCDTDVRSPKSLAESPMPKRWTENDVRPENAGVMRWDDAVFIATFDPPTILRLLDLAASNAEEIAGLKGERDAAMERAHTYAQTVDELSAMNTNLVATQGEEFVRMCERALGQGAGK